MKPSAGIFTTDSQLIVRSWDSWLARVTGIEPASARDLPVTSLIPDLEERGLLARLQRVVVDGTTEVLAPAFHGYLIRCPVQGPSERFDVMQQSVTMAPLHDGHTIIGAIVAIEDVTERLEREAAGVEDPRNGGAALPLDPMIKALESQNWEVRRIVVHELAENEGQPLLVRLLRALETGHHNLNVLSSALQALSMFQFDSLTPLAELLQHPDADVRTYVAQALGAIRDRDAIPLLLTALQDPDANVRYHAIEGLGRHRAVEAVESLISIAEGRDFFLAFPALDALAEIGDSGVTARIIPLLGNPLLRAPAMEALSRSGDAGMVDPLAQLLNTAGSPAASVAQALATLYDRYERLYGEGLYIAELAEQAIDAPGARALLQTLSTATEDEVGALARVVGWLQDPDADVALTQLLGSPQARKEVVQALVRHGPRVTQLLIEQLGADDPETQRAAAAALGRIGDPRGVPALVQALSGADELAVSAAGALGKIGDRRSFEALLGLLDHANAAVRQAVVGALNSIGHPEMTAHVSALLSSPERHLRESAVRIAGYFGYPECRELVLDLCYDPDEGVRSAAIEHVPYLDDERGLAVLVEAMESGTGKVRVAAARALAHMADAGAVPVLLAHVQDDDAWVRYAVTRSLAQQAPPEALDALIQIALHDQALPVKIAAVEALGRVDGVAAVRALENLAADENSDLASVALHALGAVRHTEALPALLEALESPDLQRRLVAARALGDRGGSEVIEPLLWVAGVDQDFEVAMQAIASLGQVGHPDAVAALIRLAADPSRQEACVSALAQTSSSMLPEVGRGLEDPRPGVRRAVIRALAQMKRPEASLIIGRALEDGDPTVRRAACESLGRLGSRQLEHNLRLLARTDPDPWVRKAAHGALNRGTEQ